MWEDEQKVPYAYKDNAWVGYDNVESIQLKVNYAKEKNLGGIMIWSIDTDDFRGKCGKPYPLLTAINEALGNVSNYFLSQLAGCLNILTHCCRRLS